MASATARDVHLLTILKQLFMFPAVRPQPLNFGHSHPLAWRQAWNELARHVIWRSGFKIGLATQTLPISSWKARRATIALPPLGDTKFQDLPQLPGNHLEERVLSDAGHKSLSCRFHRRSLSQVSAKARDVHLLTI